MSLPKSYFWYYQKEPNPGRRWWRFSDGAWYECLPNAGVASFNVLQENYCNESDDKSLGVVVTNVNNDFHEGKIHVYIPYLNEHLETFIGGKKVKGVIMWIFHRPMTLLDADG